MRWGIRARVQSCGLGMFAAVGFNLADLESGAESGELWEVLLRTGSSFRTLCSLGDRGVCWLMAARMGC